METQAKHTPVSIIIECMAEHYERGAVTSTEAAESALHAIGWPDLLEACKSALNGFRTMYEAMEEGRDASEIYADESFWPLGELRAAIAKATKQD